MKFKFNRIAPLYMNAEDGEGGGGGGEQQQQQQESWLNSLPEPFREAPFIAKAENADAALAAIKNAAQYMGNSIRIPGPDAGKEDWEKFNNTLMAKVPNLMRKPDREDPDAMNQVFQSLGRPDEANGYDLGLGEDDEIPADLEAIQAIAHKYGLTQSQFKGVFSEILGNARENNEIMNAEIQEQQDILMDKWGRAFDKNYAIVRNFARTMRAPESILEAIDDNRMSAAEMEWLHSVAKSTASTSQLETQHNNFEDGTLSPAEAQTAIQEMLNNQDHPYWKPSDPRNKEAIKRMIELQKMANPGVSTDMRYG